MCTGHNWENRALPKLRANTKLKPQKKADLQIVKKPDIKTTKYSDINLNKWKEYDNILKVVQVVIANRPEKISEVERKIINEIFDNKEIWLNNKIFSVTATEIRKKLKKNGEKFNYTIKN